MATTVMIDREVLREAIRHEYAEVATQPSKGFHFHTGRPLAERLGYPLADVDRMPRAAVESFAGVGNPFALGPLRPGEVVVDVGSGSGLDAFLAALQVGPGGRVIGVDMTPAMLETARASAAALGMTHVEFREGVAEELPVADASADVVISNGVINLSPDKEAVYREINRILKPGGRVQIADIVVRQEVPDTAKEDIALWTG